MMNMIQEILARTRTDAFRDHLRDVLVKLCDVDTTPNPDVTRMRDAESAAFDIIEAELSRLGFPGARTERRAIDPAIAGHPAYSLLHFTRTADRPEGLTPEEAYAGRSNLLYVVPGAGGGDGESVALNAHVDVIAPYIPPRVEGNVVHGRGSCDDKGPVTAILAALRVVEEILREAGQRLNRNVVCMFVVEEETGGNGSLSLALDHDLKKLYDSMIVLECTGNDIHPANRGAVWYRTELTYCGGSLLEMAAFVVEKMKREGRKIRAESRHKLFPQRPVQTCHGIIGPWGEHPSRICGEVAFRIAFERKPDTSVETLTQDCLKSAVEAYTRVYGDKTQATDPTTGRPKVERHYDVRSKARAFVVEVHGSTGHMGSIRENDCAITKMAAMVRGLVDSREQLERGAGPMRLELVGQKDPVRLVLEGGQGFVPTHGIQEVMVRMRGAAQKGAEAYLGRIGKKPSAAEAVHTTYDKLHNDAFNGDPNSPAMQNAVAAARACGMWRDQPIVGWTVSCDARLFAGEYPGMPVLTSGPGRLAHAHSDDEQLDLEEIRRCVEFLAIYILNATATLKEC